MFGKRKKQWKEIIQLALPVVISKLSFTAMGLVDTAMVGKLGAAEQGGVGIATTYMFTVYVLGLGIVSVVNTFVSQNHGAGRESECGVVLGHGLLLALIFGVFTFVVLFLSEPLFTLAGLGPEVAGAGYDYLVHRILGLFGVFLYWAYNGFLEGIGETKIPMWISIWANLVNVIGDYVFIFGFGPIPPMGVAGAGLATAACNIFMFLAFVWVIHRRGSRFARFGTGLVFKKPRRKLILDMLRTGVPMGMQYFLEIGSFLIISVIIGWVSEAALAAHQVALRLTSISFMTAWGISVASSTLVGRHQGEHRFDLARDAGMRAVILVIIYAAFCALAFLLAPGLLVSFFTPYADVAGLATSVLYVAAVFQIFDGVNMVCYGSLRGAGDTKWPLRLVIAMHWGLGIPLVYLLTIVFKMGVVGAWMGMTAMFVIQSSLIFARFRGGKWRHFTVIET